MAYGLYLYKSITTPLGVQRIEIYKDGYEGLSSEIESLSKDSILLTMDGDSITDAIIASSLSFSIVDTGQLDYQEFFTPSATKYKVVWLTGEVTRWTGFLTPDSYEERLAFRDVITLTARDNLNWLNDLPFDSTNKTYTIWALLTEAIYKSGNAMDLSWGTTKVAFGNDADLSNTVRQAMFSTELFAEKSWYDVIEMVLEGVGCQLRYNDNNSFLITDLSLLPDRSWYAARFIGKSGVRQKVAALKSFEIKQDYGLADNGYEGQFSKADCGSGNTFSPPPGSKWSFGSANTLMRLYNMWPYEQDEGLDEAIYITAYQRATDEYGNLAHNIVYSQYLRGIDRGLNIKFSINNTLRDVTNGKMYAECVGSSAIGYEPQAAYKVLFRYNIFFEQDTGGTLLLRESWVEDDGTHLQFIMDTAGGKLDSDGGTWRPINIEQEVSISATSLPGNGTLKIVIYNVLVQSIVVGSIGNYAAFTNRACARISNLNISFENGDASQSANVQVNADCNLSDDLDVKIGQVPLNKGDNFAYKGGLFEPVGYRTTPLTQWRRNSTSAERYNLLELVARERIHFAYRSYDVLSGELMMDNSHLLHFNELLLVGGKLFLPVSFDYNIIQNTINASTLQEVEEYSTQSLTFILSPVETSEGEKLKSGVNTIIQFSNQAGNGKRIYDLTDASAEDMANAFLLIDKGGLLEGRRVALDVIYQDLFEKQTIDSVVYITTHYRFNILSSRVLQLPTAAPVSGDIAAGQVALYAADSSWTEAGGTPSGIDRTELFEILGGLPSAGEAINNNFLTGIADWAKGATMPIATSSSLGGVKVGDNLAITDGILRAEVYTGQGEFGLNFVDANATTYLLSTDGYNLTLDGDAIAWANHTHSQYLTGIDSSMISTALGYTPASLTPATQNDNGLMSYADKKKLDDFLVAPYYVKAITASGNNISLTASGSTYGDGKDVAINASLSGQNVIDALGYTPYNGANLASASVNYANSAGNADSVLRATFGNASNSEHDCNNITSNGLWYYTSNGPTQGSSTSEGGLYSQAYNTNWVAQIAQDYRNGRLFIRGKNNGSWTSWLNVLDSSNFSNYAIPEPTALGGTELNTTSFRTYNNSLETGIQMNRAGAGKGWVGTYGSSTYLYHGNTYKYLKLLDNGSLRYDGYMELYPTDTGNFNEGLRIHSANNGWTSLVFCGTDNTGSSGTSANSWSFHSNLGNFFLNRNGSKNDTPYILCNVGGNWGMGNASPSAKLDVYRSFDMSTPVARVSNGYICPNIPYDDLIVSSYYYATIRIAESDGTQVGICGGNSHGTITSTHDFRFYTNCGVSTPIYAGASGILRLGLNYGGYSVYLNGSTRVDGSLSVNGTGYFDGYVTCAAGAGKSSDMRYKKNIVPLTDTLSLIRGLDTFEYEWHREGDKDNHSIGMSAQQWEQTPYSWLVDRDSNGVRRLNYLDMVTFAFAGIKELDEKYDKMAREIKSLRAEIKRLRHE